MRKILLSLCMGSLWLFAEGTTDVVAPLSISLLWLVASLLIVVLFFWGMYKVITTKNPKYGYVILFAGVLMVASVFI